MKRNGRREFAEKISAVLEAHHVQYRPYSDMADLIDGPYNGPGLESEDARTMFQKEYAEARDLFVEVLQSEGVKTELMDIIDFMQGSRCLGVFLGSHVSQLSGLIIAAERTIAILAERQHFYGVSIDADYSFRVGKGVSTDHWYIGLTQNNLLCHHAPSPVGAVVE
ncbi:MAG: hypothetical protein K9N23_17895 [Akkermansiaceae bacterium]|nr:hypothetical protein [Akkermansiaceae bacterium]